MPRGLMNWTFHDVVRFLKDKKFRHSYTHGSHYYYIGSYNGIMRQVSVPFHGSKSIKPRTMKSIVAQSGMSQEEWLGR
jgi:predicted RNA binding protein YcfA (HicA-like mRNA interferase family)